MNGLDLLAQVETGTIPAIFFDPQYRGILDKLSYGNEGARQQGRVRLVQMDTAAIREFLTHIERVLQPSGHLFLWIDKFILVSGELQDLLAGLGTLNRVDLITWDKCLFGMGYRTRRQAEYLVVLQKSPKRAKGVWTKHNIPDVWPERAIRGGHPHAKPERLQRALIEAVTLEGDIVLDPAAGGYSVLTAALSCSRRFLGCDLGFVAPPVPKFKKWDILDILSA